MKKNRLFAAAMAACLTAVSLAGCGSSSSSETTAAATTAAAAESKAEGGDTAAAGDAVGPWKSGDNVYIDVPAKAGGGTDLYTRYLTQALGEVCPGVNFVVTCHGGAIIQYLAGSSEVNIKDDLKVVGIMNQGGPQAIIAKPGAPYKNFAELADYIKANPGQVVIGCSLGGTTQVLFTSLVEALTGDANSVNYEVLTYEGYGPSGVAVIVDTLTDNKNRTAANVRSAFTKGNGNIGTQGSVSFMFDKKGQIIIDKEECDLDADELMMMALDAGAEDFSEEEDSFEIITDPDDFSAVRETLEKEGIPMMEADVTMIPQTWVELTDENDIKYMNRLLDLLDDDDDVQAVYHNWDTDER